MTTSQTAAATGWPRPSTSDSIDECMSLFRKLTPLQQANALMGLQKIAEGRCVFSGPGVYRMRESLTSERSSLYQVEEVIEHPDGPFIRCRPVDSDAVLPVTFQGPFEAWAVERIGGVGDAA